MNAIDEASGIILQKAVEKAQELATARVAYRALVSAGDGAEPGDGTTLANAMELLQITVSDARADAKAIAARRRVEAEIAAAEAEASRISTEAGALKASIAQIVQNNRDSRVAGETIRRQQELFTTAEGLAYDDRRLREKMRTIEQTAPRIFGIWK